jgi:raffinose/stachyose/melibiose transport system permease protein
MPRKLNWRHLPLALVALYALVPMALLAINSFKTETDITYNPMGLPTQWTLQNYADAWTQGDLAQGYINTLLIAVATVLLECLVAALAAYALSHLNPPGSNLVTGYLFLSLSLPVAFVPLFFIDVKLGLINNYFGVIIPYVGGGFAFNVFLLRAFMIGISKELVESARVDGAGNLAIFARIIAPLSQPAFIIVAIFTSLGTWNEILLANAVLQDNRYRTLAVSYLDFQTQHSTAWSLMAADGVMTTLPMVLLFLLMTKRFITGLQEGGLKF